MERLGLMQQPKTKRTAIPVLVVCILLAGVTFGIVSSRQYIIDQLNVWQYQSTAEISSLADRSGMSETGKFLFYASQPVLDGTQNFNDMCERVEIMTAILGCYSDYRIYLYDISDPQLDGIREVTAAHEMLHAAYLRMSNSEKQDVNVLLESEYGKMKSDEKYVELMNFYARTEPGQRYNELHSVIGTELISIEPKLENYYKKYFSDRSKVTALNAKYKSVFEDLQKKADSLSDQIAVLSAEISKGTNKYNRDITSLNADIVKFNAKADSGSFNSISQFNYEKSLLLARVSGLEADRGLINNNIEKYNLLLQEYNSIASQSKKLNNSIDSSLAPTPIVQ